MNDPSWKNNKKPRFISPKEIRFSISDNKAYVEYGILEIEVSPKGKCKVSSHRYNAARNLKITRDTLIEKNVDKIKSVADAYIAKGEIRTTKEFLDTPGDIPTTEAIEESDDTNVYVARIIKSRIPNLIQAKDLIFIGMEWDSPDSSDVYYCIKPSLYREYSESLNFYLVDIAVKKGMKCSYKFRESWMDDKKYIVNNQQKAIPDSELEDIYEAAFRYILKAAVTRPLKLNIRFLSLHLNSPLNENFFSRFKDCKPPVRSPFVKQKDYKPEAFNGRYPLDSRDALFYSIDGVTPFDENHVFVECSVIWRMHTGQGYNYFLEKKGGKWTVVKVKSTWFS